MSMPVRDLRSTALRAAQISIIFDHNQDGVHPARLTHLQCPSSVVRIEIAPGGRQILVMHADGTVTLHDIHDVVTPILTITRPQTPYPYAWNTSPKYVLISSTAQGENLVLVSEGYNDRM